MRLKTNARSISEIYLLILMMAVLTACQKNLLSYRGATARHDSRINLQEGGPHEGRWQTRDLSVNYRYQRDANTLRVSGVVELENHLKYNFGMLERLKLWVNYLDVEGKVLDYKLILISDYRQTIRTMTFSYQLQLPPDSTGMAFSYSGRAIDGGAGNNGAADWRFQYVPRR